MTQPQGQGFYLPANFNPNMQPKLQAHAITPKPTVAPKPIIRAQAPEENSATRAIAMPMPEQFGINRLTAGKQQVREVDWALVHRKLHEAGSVCFQTEKLPEGYRLVCMVPSRTAGQLQRFEATSPDQSHAVDMILSHLEHFQRGR